MASGADPSQGTVLQGLRQALNDWTWPPLLQRDWRGEATEGTALRVLSFNVLAESKQSDEKWSAPALDALKEWVPRRLRLLEVLLQEDPDLIFLQELDVNETGESALCPELRECGYDAVFPPTSGPVPALFLRRRRFQLLEAVPNLDFAAVAVVQDSQAAGATLAIASGHLKSGKDSAAEAERSAQVSQLLDHLQRRGCAAVIFAADLNAVPVVDSKIGAPLAYSMVLGHPLQLRSAYAFPGSEEPEYTTWKLRPKGEIKRSIDYIFYSPGLQPTSVLSLPTEMPPERLPCLAYPSDHLALATDFIYTSG